MKYTSLFLLALICVSQVAAVSLRRNINNLAIDNLHSLAKKNTYSSRIAAAVELHLSSGGQVDKAIELVQEALNDVQGKRNDLQKEFDLFVSDHNAGIAEDVHQLTELNAQLNVVNGEIEQLTGEISNLESQVSRLQHEIDDLNTREKLIEQARQNDINTWNKRNVRDQNALEALGLIIEELTKLLERGNVFLQQNSEQINRAMKRIPLNNPIKALVTLSTKFDENKLRSVIEKLRQIEDSVRNGNNEDAERERLSKEHYDQLMSELTSVRNSKYEQLAEAQRDLKEKQERLQVKKDEASNLVNLIAQVSQHKQQLEDDLARETPVYEHRLSEADEAIAGIREALRILEDHRASLHRSEALADELHNGSWEY